MALASGIAFLLVESLDLFVNTPLQRRHFISGVVASNIVGVVVDSIVFLTVAFGSLSLFEGQVIGKARMTLVAIPVVLAIREWDRKRGIVPFGADPLPT